MSSIFLSHSTSDQETAAELAQYLREDGFESLFLSFDAEHGIPPGADWERDLYRQLKSCAALVALCSEQWVNSRWCFAEIALAKALGKAVFPIRIADCAIPPLLVDRQVIDGRGDLRRVLDRLQRGFLNAGIKFERRWRPERAPFPGLNCFEEADSPVFFGREAESIEVIEALSRMKRRREPRALVLVGASGSGKSSLLRAGVLPRLQTNSGWLALPAFRVIANPYDGLAHAFGRAFRRIEMESTRAPDIAPRLRRGGASALNEVSRQLVLGSSIETNDVLVSIDPIEELLDSEHTDSAPPLLEMLAAAIRDDESVIFLLATLRSDQMEAWQAYSERIGLTFTAFNVARMSLDHFTDAVTGPARLAAIEIEDGLEHQMVDDAKTEDALPLLAFTLRAMYDRNRRLFARSLYENELGGLRGAVARAASRAAPEWETSDADWKLLRSVFLQMVELGEDGRFVRRAVDWNSLSPRARDLLTDFIEERLLVLNGDGSEAKLEIVHEALFRVWHRLSEWLTENRDFLNWRKRLRAAVDDWKRHAHDPEELIRGPALVESERWRAERSSELAKDELNFLQRSVVHHRKRLWFRRAAVVSLAAITMFSLFALNRSMRAEREANYRRLVAESTRLVETQPDVGLLLAVQAYDSYPNRTTAGALVRAVNHHPRLHRMHHMAQPVRAVAFNPAKRLIAAGDESGRIRLWHADTGEPTAELLGHDGAVWALAFRPDGELLASAGDFGVVVHDWQRDESRYIERPGRDRFHTVAFRPGDPQTLAYGGTDSLVTLWNSQQNSKTQHSFGRNHVYTLAFDSDGGRLAAAGVGWEFLYLDPETSSGPTMVDAGPAALNLKSVVFDVLSDAVLYAAEVSGGGGQIWSFDPNTMEHRLVGETRTVISSLAVHPQSSSNLVAGAGEDGKIRLWSVSGRRAVDSAWQAHDGLSRDIAFTDGEHILSGGGDGKVVLWRHSETGDHRAIRLVGSHKPGLSEVVVGNDGNAVASSAENELAIWRKDDAQWTRQFSVAADAEIMALAFGLQEEVFAGDAAGTLAVWNLDEREIDRRVSLESAPRSIDVGGLRQRVAAGLDNGQIIVCNSALTACESIPPRHEGRVRCIYVSPNEDFLLSCGIDGKLLAWDFGRGTQQVLWEAGNPIFSVASLDGKRVFSSLDLKGNIGIWQLSDKRAEGWTWLGSLSPGDMGCDPPISMAVFEVPPWGEVLAVEQDCREFSGFALWDVRLRDEIARFQVAGVTALVAASKGTKGAGDLIIASNSGQLGVWTGLLWARSEGCRIANSDPGEATSFEFLFNDGPCGQPINRGMN